MPTKLRKLVINEISLVDRGANQHAHITLFKRDTPPEIEMPEETYADRDGNFEAKGKGPGHDRLFVAYDNLRRQANFPASAFRQAWAELSDDDRDLIRAEEAAHTAALAAKADAEAKERQRQMSKMDDMKLQEIIKIAGDIDAGRMGNHATKSQWYQALSKLAESERKPNETREMAVARVINEDAGKLLFKAYRNAAGADYSPPAKPVAVAKATPARDEINKLADEFVTADPSLTKYSALLKVHAEMPELAAKAKAEAFA